MMTVTFIAHLKFWICLLMYCTASCDLVMCYRKVKFSSVQRNGRMPVHHSNSRDKHHAGSLYSCKFHPQRVKEEIK